MPATGDSLTRLESAALERARQLASTSTETAVLGQRKRAVRPKTATAASRTVARNRPRQPARPDGDDIDLDLSPISPIRRMDLAPGRSRATRHRLSSDSGDGDLGSGGGELDGDAAGSGFEGGGAMGGWLLGPAATHAGGDDQRLPAWLMAQDVDDPLWFPGGLPVPMARLGNLTSVWSDAPAHPRMPARRLEPGLQYPGLWQEVNALDDQAQPGQSGWSRPPAGGAVWRLGVVANAHQPLPETPVAGADADVESDQDPGALELLVRAGFLASEPVLRDGRARRLQSAAGKRLAWSLQRKLQPPSTARQAHLPQGAGLAEDPVFAFPTHPRRNPARPPQLPRPELPQPDLPQPDSPTFEKFPAEPSPSLAAAESSIRRVATVGSPVSHRVLGTPPPAPWDHGGQVVLSPHANSAAIPASPIHQQRQHQPQLEPEQPSPAATPLGESLQSSQRFRRHRRSTRIVEADDETPDSDAGIPGGGDVAAPVSEHVRQTPARSPPGTPGSPEGGRVQGSSWDDHDDPDDGSDHDGPAWNRTRRLDKRKLVRKSPFLTGSKGSGRKRRAWERYADDEAEESEGEGDTKRRRRRRNGNDSVDGLEEEDEDDEYDLNDSFVCDSAADGSDGSHSEGTAAAMYMSSLMKTPPSRGRDLLPERILAKLRERLQAADAGPDEEMDDSDGEFVVAEDEGDRTEEDKSAEEDEAHSLKLSQSVTFNDARASDRRQKEHRKQLLRELAYRRRQKLQPRPAQHPTTSGTSSSTLSSAPSSSPSSSSSSSSAPLSFAAVRSHTVRPPAAPPAAGSRPPQQRAAHPVVVDMDEDDDDDDDIDLEEIEEVPISAAARRHHIRRSPQAAKPPVACAAIGAQSEGEDSGGDGHLLRPISSVSLPQNQLRAPLRSESTRDRLDRYRLRALAGLQQQSPHADRGDVPAAVAETATAIPISPASAAAALAALDQVAIRVSHDLIHGSLGNNLAVIVDAREAHSSAISRSLRNRYRLHPVISQTHTPPADYIVSQSTAVLRVGLDEISQRQDYSRKGSGAPAVSARGVEGRLLQVRRLLQRYEKVFVILERPAPNKLLGRPGKTSAAAFLNAASSLAVANLAPTQGPDRSGLSGSARLSSLDRFRLKLAFLPGVHTLDSSDQHHSASLINSLVRAEANILLPFAASACPDPGTRTGFRLIPGILADCRTAGALRIPPRLWAALGGAAEDATETMLQLDGPIRESLAGAAKEILALLAGTPSSPQHASDRAITPEQSPSEIQFDPLSGTPNSQLEQGQRGWGVRYVAGACKDYTAKLAFLRAYPGISLPYTVQLLRRYQLNLAELVCLDQQQLLEDETSELLLYLRLPAQLDAFRRRRRRENDSTSSNEVASATEPTSSQLDFLAPLLVAPAQIPAQRIQDLTGYLRRQFCIP